MKKILILLLVLFSISCFGLKKEFYFVKGGLSIAKFTGNDVKNEKDKIGFNLGFGASYKINNYFLFTPELSYAQKGCIFNIEIDNVFEENEEDTIDETLIYSVNYLEIAPLITLKAKTKSNTKPFLKAGPYYSILLNSKYEYDKQNRTGDADNGFNDNDFGFIIGIGFDLKTTYFEARLTKGLTNIIKTLPEAPKAETLTFNINLAYKFDFAN